MSSPFFVPEITESQIVYTGYFDVRVDQLQSTDKASQMTYTSLDIKAHAAAVLARTREGTLILNREYRHPTGKWILGCPGGRMDPGESALETGKRELLEETGYSGGEAKILGEVFSLPAVADQIIHYLFLDGVELTHTPEREPFELIHIELKKPQDLFREIKQGTLIDGVLCTALFLSINRGLLCIEK